MNNDTAPVTPNQNVVMSVPDASLHPDMAPPVATEHIDRLCAMAAALLEVPFVTVVWAAEGTQVQQHCWIHGKADHPAQIDAIRTLCSCSVLGDMPVTVQDLHASSAFRWPLLVRDGSIRAYAGVPLKTPTAQFIGYLYAIDLVARFWSERELRILTTLCSLVALAIKLSDIASDSEHRLQAIAAERDAQDEMLAEIAHDLRQPLALIAVVGELLDRDAPQHRRENAEMLRGGVRTMKTLIAEMLGGDAPSTLDLQPIDPASLVRKAVWYFTPLAARRGLHIEGSTEQGLPTIRCDHAKVQRVYSNLIGNAIAYADPRSTIRLAGEPVSDGVQFCVTNDGPIIPADDSLHVFDRGWQACRHGKGRGLGLAIVRKLVEAHGGSVAVHSGGGTNSFCFTLPLTQDTMNRRERELQFA